MSQKLTKPKLSSRGLRWLFDISSNLLRACVAPSSGLLRLLFDCPSGASRSPLEAEPKPSRNVAEHVSNESRRGPEALPKPSRRAKGVEIPIRLRLYFTYICEALARYSDRSYCKSTGRVLTNGAVPPSDFLLTNTCLSSALYAAGSQFSSGQHLRGSTKNLCRLDENPRKGQIWSGVDRYLTGLFPATKGTIDSRLSYRECTESVPKRYWKGTKELLKRYQIATRQVQAFSSFLVNRRYKLGRAMEIPTKMHRGNLVSGGDGCRLKSEDLQAFSVTRVCRNGCLAVQKKIGAQKALKYFSVVAGYGKGYRMSLTCLLLMIVSMFSLLAQTPRKDSGADGLFSLVTLKPGDKIPDAVWNQSLELNYFNGKKRTIKFSDLKGKLILLDFWSTGCPSCIEGIPKMEWIQQRFLDNIQVIMVNSKRNKDTAKRIKTRFEKFKADFNFTPSLPTVLDDTIFTALFAHNTLPALAVVDTNGVFIAMTSSHSLTDKNIQALLDGNAVLKSEGNYKNLTRSAAEPLLDTVGMHYISAFGGYRENYLPVYPNLNHKNGTTFLQMGNQSLQFMLFQAHGKALKGFRQNDLVIDARLGRQFKEKLLNGNSTKNKCWYQFYADDSVSRQQFEDIFCREFQNYFKIAVARKSDSIELYKIRFSDKIKNILTSGKASIARFQGIGEEAFYQNIPIRLFLQNLFYAFDLPTELQEKENFNIDIIVPVDFVRWTEQEKLSFLKERGIVFTAVKEYRTYPFVYPIY
ncbi:TlpA disulfide reductase family protein [Sphingobacterium sp. BIGb0165]|uniref:TlpA family protein disulfide reductase n=1 Tax=Sphingobacterium sp. BIGb0165 TaxID=2940615 RepID=UPI00216A9C22|nr:TlpA disulfide reductase family protein [Sphingobacterium sp. BIGb0165]MCS4229122.1 thiol-disulfide isomerase/thioredoxin [Sphingobacterium sp. BIGb0165]